MKNTTSTKKNADKRTETLRAEIERKHIIEAKSDAAEKLRELFVDSLKDIY